MRAPTLSNDGMKSSLAVSATLHLALLLFLYFGLPRLIPPLPEHHAPVPFEIVEVADITNTRVEEPKPQVQPAPPPPPPKQEEKPAPPPPVQALPQPKPEEAIAMKPAEKPKPPEPKKIVQEDFSKLLKNLEINKKQEAPKTDAKPDPKSQAQVTPQSQAPSLSNRLTISEEDLLRRQIEQCWSPPIGAKDAQSQIVEIAIDVNPDRTVANAEIVDKSRYASDPFFRAAAEAARRAVLNPHCSPLQLPADKYDQWKHIDFTFDPRDIL